MAIWTHEEIGAWDDLRVPVFSTTRGGAKDPDIAKVLDNGAGSQGVVTYLFDKAVEEELYFTVQIPHTWKYGTDIKPHVHWMPVADGAAGSKVCWGLEYSLSEHGATFQNTTIIYGDEHIPIETLVADRHYVNSLGTISMAAVDSLSAMLICRIFRDATGTGGTDDYDNDSALLEIDFHYQIDSQGSRFEYIK
jgi:hypothetical protein